MNEMHKHKRRSFKFAGASGGQFEVWLRQSTLNVMDFSVILGYVPPGQFRVFRLRRYNGNAHQHTNTLERQTLDGFHIHTATERYQRLPGSREDHFAERTARYFDLDSAIECLLEDCGFLAPIEESPIFSGQS